MFLTVSIIQLAVQAATGATRHFSFEALIALQQQLSLTTDGSEDHLFNSRLSRVVTKLFSRVVKAEEASSMPFASPSVDVEAIICFLEDALVACEKVDNGRISQDAISATTNLAKVLVNSILKARNETASILGQMEQLEINPESSALGRLVAVCASELGLTNRANHPFPSCSRDVSALVSAVGEAHIGPERDAAVAALRQYKAEYGDDDLNNHLNDVSSAFRAFILEQLSMSNPPSEEDKSSPVSMSERIKSLRSKLNSTDPVVQTVMDQSVEQESTVKGVATDDTTNNTRPLVASSASVRAFRERLAAAHDKRTISSEIESKEVAEVTTTAGSRAAALRARLQAVKRQAEQADF